MDIVNSAAKRNALTSNCRITNLAISANVTFKTKVIKLALGPAFLIQAKPLAMPGVRYIDSESANKLLDLQTSAQNERA